MRRIFERARLAHEQVDNVHRGMLVFFLVSAVILGFVIHLGWSHEPREGLTGPIATSTSVPTAPALAGDELAGAALLDTEETRIGDHRVIVRRTTPESGEEELVARVQDLPASEGTSEVPVIQTDTLRYQVRNDCADTPPSQAALFLASDGQGARHEIRLPMDSQGSGGIVVPRDGQRYWIEARSSEGGVLATSHVYVSDGTTVAPLLILAVCEPRGGPTVRVWDGKLGQPGAAELFVWNGARWLPRGYGHEIELVLDDPPQALAVTERSMARIVVDAAVVDCILQECSVRLQLPELAGELADLELAVALRHTDRDLPNARSHYSDFGRGGSIVECSIPMAGKYFVDVRPRLSVDGIPATGDAYGGGVGCCGVVVLDPHAAEDGPVAIDVPIELLQRHARALRERISRGKGR